MGATHHSERHRQREAGQCARYASTRLETTARCDGIHGRSSRFLFYSIDGDARSLAERIMAGFEVGCRKRRQEDRYCHSASEGRIQRIAAVIYDFFLDQLLHLTQDFTASS